MYSSCKLSILLFSSFTPFFFFSSSFFPSSFHPSFQLLSLLFSYPNFLRPLNDLLLSPLLFLIISVFCLFIHCFLSRKKQSSPLSNSVPDPLPFTSSLLELHFSFLWTLSLSFLPISSFFLFLLFLPKYQSLSFFSLRSSFVTNCDVHFELELFVTSLLSPQQVFLFSLILLSLYDYHTDSKSILHSSTRIINRCRKLMVCFTSSLFSPLLFSFLFSLLPFFHAVKPLEVTIISPKRILSSGVRTELSCRSSGSRPPAQITWWMGSYQIKAADVRQTLSSDGNISHSSFSFIPTPNDNQMIISCRAQNVILRNVPLEEKMLLEVHCKFLHIFLLFLLSLFPPFSLLFLSLLFLSLSLFLRYFFFLSFSFSSFVICLSGIFCPSVQLSKSLIPSAETITFFSQKRLKNVLSKNTSK